MNATDFALRRACAQVGYFTGHWSTAGKMYKEQFEALCLKVLAFSAEAMAKSYPKYSFYTCDIDDAPLAAYDAEVPSGFQAVWKGVAPPPGHGSA